VMTVAHAARETLVPSIHSSSLFLAVIGYVDEMGLSLGKGSVGQKVWSGSVP